MKENMYYGASNLTFQKAEELRNRMTPAEEILWKHIHINQWKVKFRRQHPIWNYIADFYCHGLKLVIELDGGIHEVEEVKKNDKLRESHLHEMGLTVLRFQNKEVLNNINAVLNTISQTIEKLRNSPLGPPDPVRAGVRRNLFIIKIGGNIIDDKEKLSLFLKQFAEIKSPIQARPIRYGRGMGVNKILVHGGGKLATRLADQLGIQQQMFEGRRITDAETLKIVTMVYAGYINKNITAQLQSLGCNAIGLSGADGNVILSHKRTAESALGNGCKIDFGFVGDIDEVNFSFLDNLLQHNSTPVIAPITHDGKGQLLNTNADSIAQEIAKAMSNLYEVTLIYAFEKSGVLLDINDESSIIKKINWKEYQKLKEPTGSPKDGGDGGKIFAGMIPKLDNAFQALNNGVKKVIIGNAENLNELINGTAGTSIVNE